MLRRPKPTSTSYLFISILYIQYHPKRTRSWLDSLRKHSEVLESLLPVTAGSKAKSNLDRIIGAHIVEDRLGVGFFRTKLGQSGS